MTELEITPGYPNDFGQFPETTGIQTLKIIKPNYNCYQHFADVVNLSDFIANFTEVRIISITAPIVTLPINLCTLQKLVLLDLSGCYNILSIPSEVLAMPSLNIKIGTVISPASQVIGIKIPLMFFQMRFRSFLFIKNLSETLLMKMNVAKLFSLMTSRQKSSDLFLWE